MYKYRPCAGIKKWPRWTMAITALIYYIAAAYAIYHTAKINYAAAYLPCSYSADTWVAAIIGGGCAVGWGIWCKKKSCPIRRR